VQFCAPFNRYAIVQQNGLWTKSPSPSCAVFFRFSPMRPPVPTVLRTCVSRGYASETTVQERVSALAERAQNLQVTQSPNRPDTRSPLDPWHEEGYLIACLVRMHGWSQPAPGELLNLKRRLAK
jgi:hypothetical protein